MTTISLSNVWRASEVQNSVVWHHVSSFPFSEILSSCIFVSNPLESYLAANALATLQRFVSHGYHHFRYLFKAEKADYIPAIAVAEHQIPQDTITQLRI